jgi:FkbM family methyltransferase
MLLSTAKKLFIAGVIYRILRLLGFSRYQEIERQNVRYYVDLSEGIDLSLFLFGSFQAHVLNEDLMPQFPADAIFLDVGANIGTISLSMAQRYPEATVIAVEPTHYAFKKLEKNIALNPGFEGRVRAIQSFLGAELSDDSSFIAYSSWKVDGSKDESQNEIHLGVEKESTQKQLTIDKLLELESVDRLDFIKIDTDGYELEVLRGGQKLLAEHKPCIVFELSIDIQSSVGHNYKEFEELLYPLGYEFYNTANGRKLSEGILREEVPRNGSIDVIARIGEV